MSVAPVPTVPSPTSTSRTFPVTVEPRPRWVSSDWDLTPEDADRMFRRMGVPTPFSGDDRPVRPAASRLLAGFV